MFPYRVTAMVAVSVVDLLILQTSLPPFDLWLVFKSIYYHRHHRLTSTNIRPIPTVISQRHHHDRRLVPQRNRHRQPRRRRLSSRRSPGIKIIPSLPSPPSKNAPANSPLQPLTFHLQANLSSISGVLSSTLLIEFPGCQKYIIDLLLKI